jgi:hypothetical protein
MHPQVERQPREFELRAWHHGVIFLLACAVIISRRPDAVFHAQFFAEDGHVWYAEAYNLGWWNALLRSQDGYFQTFPRLGAALALLVPLSQAPLALNLIAICVQALPVNVLLSFRSSAWGSLRFRSVLACIYLGLPNCFELHETITGAQWRLAFCAFLLLVAFRPQSRAGRVFDLSIFSLCGLTGPFCILLSPIALFVAWQRRERWRWVTAGILCATSLLEASNLLRGGIAGRPHVALGASLATLIRMIAGQLYLGTFIGSNALAARPGIGAFIVFACIAAGGTLLMAICFFRSGWNLRLLIIFSGMVVVASLVSPTLGQINGYTGFEALVRGAAARYWFFPDLAFAWSILFCFRNGNQVLKAVSVGLLCIMCFGFAARWEYPAFRDEHFAEYVKTFASAPAGTAVVIPENPEGWNARLIRHDSKWHGSK